MSHSEYPPSASPKHASLLRRRLLRRCSVVTIGAALASGCVQTDLPGDSSAARESLLYLLQPEGVALADLVAQPFTWLILEPSREGDVASEFSSSDIQSLRTTGPCGGKLVLAYLSIGEAEDYRDYWDPGWVNGQGGPPIPGAAPAWLGPSNPDFPSNYKVRYWDADWQALILGTAAGPAKTPFDRIIDAGYDGVYLDIIDAFEFWSEPEGGNELTRAEARARMIGWVLRIAEYARATRGVAGFLVFPQNGEEIVYDDDGELDAMSEAYFSAISGIGIEDLFYDGLTPRPETDVEQRVGTLLEYHRRAKTVLVTDYVLADPPSVANDGPRAAEFYDAAETLGFIPYAAVQDRDLDEIVVLSPDDWPVAQPPVNCPAAP